MNIETKFNLGDKVFTLRTWEGTEKVPCTTCSGTGRLKVEGQEMTVLCPRCTCGHVWGSQGLQASVSDTPDAIGKIEVSVYANKEGVSKAQRGKKPEKYMLYETGIGSGTVYKAEDLFTTREEAVAIGKKRIAAWKRGNKKG